MNKIKILVGSAIGAVGTFALTLAAHAQTAITWTATDTDAVVQPNLTAFKSALIYVVSSVGPFLLGILAAFAVIAVIFGLVALYRHFHK